MHLGFLEQSSKVTPLLVRIYDTQRLNGLVKNEARAVNEKGDLTSVVCELLDMKLSVRESELIADVMIGLLRQAEIDVRQSLAERLASHDNVPLRLVLQLASDEITVAGSVLSRSEVLSDLDLIYIIKSQSSEHWEAIAQRPTMSDQVMNMLADTGDLDTAIQLAKNNQVVLSEYTITALSDMAQGSDVLAMPLLRRNEVSETVAQKLYQFVGEKIKSYIVEEYGITQSDVVEAIDDVLNEMEKNAVNRDEFMPTSAMIKDSKRQKDKGLLTMKLMLASLRRGQIQTFVAQFSSFVEISPENIIEILKQSTGQGLAVACRAMGVPKEDFMSIYLLTNRMRSNGQMIELADMTKAASYFTRLDQKIARNILENSKED